MSKKKLYHPLCHLIHGERLYFLIISFKYEAISSAKMIVAKLNDFNLADSSCAHLIFGDMDIVLRIWAPEVKINQLADYISTLENVRRFRLLLSENMTPWYLYGINQKLRNKHNHPAFSQEKIDTLLNGTIGSEYYVNYNETTEIVSMYKFWLFIEEQFPNNSSIYDRLSSEVRKMRYKKNREKYEVENLSLYSYLTSNHRGVIIKANSYNFIESCSKLSELVHQYSNDSEIRITTYIARSQLKDDIDNVFMEQINNRPIDNRKKDIIYNLFMSHDCNKQVYAPNSEERNLLNAFSTILEPIFYELFLYNKLWCVKVRQARSAMKWIVEKKNSTLISVLLREYVSLERKLKSILNDMFLEHKHSIKDFPRIKKRFIKQLDISENQADIILEIIDKKFLPKKMTFGDVPSLLAILTKTCSSQTQDCKLLGDFSSVITKLSQQRNMLAHGNKTKLFKLDKMNKKWVWEDFAYNYLQYHFFNPEWQTVLKKVVSDLTKEKLE